MATAKSPSKASIMNNIIDQGDISLDIFDTSRESAIVNPMKQPRAKAKKRTATSMLIKDQVKGTRLMLCLVSVNGWMTTQTRT